MPTTQPRYTVTDTGQVRDLLDLAHRRWPEIEDRRQLLLRLAAVGAERVSSELDAVETEERRRRQHEALARAPQLLDIGPLLQDDAWR